MLIRYFEAIFVLHKCIMKYLPSLVYLTQAVSCLVLPCADHRPSSPGIRDQSPVSAAQCPGPEAGTPCTMNTTNYTGSRHLNLKMLSSL